IASARLRMMAGDLDSVLRETDAIDDAAARARTDWPASATFVAICRFFALVGSGRLDDADDLAHARLEISLGDPLPAMRAIWTEGRGIVALTRGHLAEGEQHLSEVAAMLRGQDNGTMRLALHELAMVYALGGHVDEAEGALAEAETAVHGIMEPFV